MSEVLKLYKVYPEVVLPSHQTEQSACFDLMLQACRKGSIKGFSSMNKPVERLYSGNLTLSPGDRMMIPTGLIMDIPQGYSVRIHARSGLSLKSGLVLVNAEAVIDSDYVEEVFILLMNISENSITVREGDRLAQAELVKTVDYTIEATPIRPIPKTSRNGGLGSTGVAGLETLSKIETNKDLLIININEDMKPPEVKKQSTPEIPIKRGRGRPKKSATGTH